MNCRTFLFIVAVFFIVKWYFLDPSESQIPEINPETFQSGSEKTEENRGWILTFIFGIFSLFGLCFSCLGSGFSLILLAAWAIVQFLWYLIQQLWLIKTIWIVLMTILNIVVISTSEFALKRDMYLRNRLGFYGSLLLVVGVTTAFNYYLVH